MAAWNKSGPGRRHIPGRCLKKSYPFIGQFLLPIFRREPQFFHVSALQQFSFCRRIRLGIPRLKRFIAPQYPKLFPVVVNRCSAEHDMIAPGPELLQFFQLPGGVIPASHSRHPAADDKPPDRCRAPEYRMHHHYRNPVAVPVCLNSSNSGAAVPVYPADMAHGNVRHHRRSACPLGSRSRHND